MGYIQIELLLMVALLAVAAYVYFGILNKRSPYTPDEEDNTKGSWRGKSNNQMVVTTPVFFAKNSYGQIKVLDTDPDANKGRLILAYDKKKPSQVSVICQYSGREIFRGELTRSQLREHLAGGEYKQHQNDNMPAAEREGIFISLQQVERKLRRVYPDPKKMLQVVQINSIASDLDEGVYYPILSHPYGQQLAAVLIPAPMLAAVLEKWYEILPQDQEERMMEDEIDAGLRALLEEENKKR